MAATQIGEKWGFVDKEGKIVIWTGTYQGKISGGTIDGRWTKPDGSASRPLFLQEK